VILFGQPELKRIFNQRPEVLSRVDAWFRLNPVSLEDTLELIRFRNAVARCKEPLLTQGAFLKVWKATRGGVLQGDQRDRPAGHIAGRQCRGVRRPAGFAAAARRSGRAGLMI